MAKLHHRMPMILDPADFDRWSVPEKYDRHELLKPCLDEVLEAWPVSTHVNKPANDDLTCIQPVNA